MRFNIHFFKEKSRKLDLDALFAFFQRIPECKIDVQDEEVTIAYKNEKTQAKASFIITKRSRVRDIHKLDARFLDLNFHLEMPIFTTEYNALKIFDIVADLTKKFDFYIYNELFENVLPFRREVLDKAFELIKKAYKDKNPIEYQSLAYVSEAKLRSIQKYLDEAYELQIYYKDDDIYVPRYMFLLEETTKKVFVAMEWKEGTLTLFPPALDYIFYHHGSECTILKASEVKELLGKHLKDVPGFIKGTKVCEKKYLRKIHRVMKKSHFSNVLFKFKPTELQSLIDI